MGILDRFHGHHTGAGDMTPMAAIGLTDREVAAYYRTLLQTAPPETIEQAHASAFAQLAPAQRQTILTELGHEMPPFEWETGTRFADDPRSLARMATRAELEHPGTLERIVTRLDLPADANTTGGLGGMIVGSWAASQFFADSATVSPAVDEESITPFPEGDIVIDEQSMQAGQAWRQFEHGHF
jgi:hypothetical protein